MKHKTILLAALFVGLCFASCGKKDSPSDEGKKEPYEKEQFSKDEIIKLGDFSKTESAKGVGHQYSYTLARKALDSTHVVTDADGYRAFDNQLSLTVSRDGAQIYTGVFTRQNFQSRVSAKDYKNFILMNIVFDKVTPNGPRFIISLGNAASNGDIFVQYALTVGNNGSSSISQHEMFGDDEVEHFNQDSADLDGV